MGQLTCKYCATSFDDTLKKCPDCGTKAPKRKKTAEMPASEPLSLLARTADLVEAEIITSILEAENITVISQMFDGLGMSAILGNANIGMQVEIYVPEKDFDLANNLIEEMQASGAAAEEELLEDDGYLVGEEDEA
ncbi:MAG: DUF2007 domain-containing protein [Christensenellaceae bacterium]|jgi:predicted  nucleic acid-binding Zn-ribbon protein